MVKVKVCGITNERDAKLSVSLGAWALGFIFYKKSPRYVNPIMARRIIADLPKSVMPVGVFVNEKKTRINKIIAMCSLRAIQLHGDETPAFCRSFKKVKTIRAVRVSKEFALAQLKEYKTDYFLFDTFHKKMYGGSGKTFDWSVFKGKHKIKKPIILSGGINVNNVREAARKVKPFAIDVSSGVERSPGKKCSRRLKVFFKEVKKIRR